MSPFDLNLRHLRGLLAVCELGSVSAAAQSMDLSQPALTQGLMKLESHLEQALFDRRPHGLVATAAGQLVAERVRAVVGLLAEGARFAAAPESQWERRLSLTSVRAFLALVEAGDFASAGARIGLSQTAVHRGVRDLEAALDRKLVERLGRGIHVNFPGRRFARACRLAMAEMQAAFFELGIDPQRITITIGTTPLTRAFMVPEAMALMMESSGPVGFQVFEGSWGELVESLRDGVIDFLVGELPDYDSPDILKTVLCEEPIVIAAGHQHPLVGRHSPSLKTLASYPWIVAPRDSPLRAAWDQLFAGSTPAAPIECGSVMIIGRLLTSSTMLTLATPDQVALQIKSGLLKRVPCPPDRLARLQIGVTTRRRWRPTSTQQRFLDALASASAQIGRSKARPARMAVEWNDARPRIASTAPDAA